VTLKWTRTRNSNDFVRHVTSPSRRDKSRQVVTPNLLKFNRRRLKQQKTVQPLRHSLRPPQLTSHSHASLLLPPVRLSRISLLFKATKHECFALRNFDTELPCPYCYRLELNDRLESVASRAHRRRFARPPRSLIRAGLKSRGRCERSKRYIKPGFPQRK